MFYDGLAALGGGTIFGKLIPQVSSFAYLYVHKEMSVNECDSVHKGFLRRIFHRWRAHVFWKWYVWRLQLRICYVVIGIYICARATTYPDCFFYAHATTLGCAMLALVLNAALILRTRTMWWAWYQIWEPAVTLAKTPLAGGLVHYSRCCTPLRSLRLHHRMTMFCMYNMLQ